VANPRIEDLRKRLEKEPGSRLFAQLAEELRKEGELAEAIRVSREGLQKQPNYPSARMTLGRALFDTGDLPGARAEFEAVLKGAADNILASRLLGECLERLGDPQGALGRFKTTLALAPGDRQVAARIEALERGGAVAAAAPRPADVAAAATLMMPASALPAARAAPVAVEEPAVVEAEPEPPPIPLVAADESFELERSYEPPPAASAVAGSVAVVVPPPPFGGGEAVYEFQPGTASESAPAPASPADVEMSTATLAELYFSQGVMDKALEVYRQVLEREPGNARARTRLAEIEALERQLRAEEAQAVAGGALAGDSMTARRQAVERTIARLEGFLAALRRG